MYIKIFKIKKYLARKILGKKIFINNSIGDNQDLQLI